MLYDNLEFHNITELVTVDGAEGVRMQRAPESVRAQVNVGTGGVMLSPASSEIRFRIAEGSESATVKLSSEEGASIFVYYGPFQGPSFRLNREPKDITVKLHKRLKLLTEEQKESCDYRPELVRICFGDDYPEPVHYHGNSGNVSPPRSGDVPDKVLLAYGSSIAHGTSLSGAALSYPAHTAWKLGMDVRNLGASGCCLCEPAFADFLAEQTCDVMTLELSVNMLGQFNADEFRERAGYLVERVADSDPERPVACMTIFPHFNDMGEQLASPDAKATSEEYRQVLRDIVSGLNRPNVSLIEGADLLPDLGGLSHDLIHPGVRGMILIGENLAKALHPIINGRPIS